MDKFRPNLLVSDHIENANERLRDECAGQLENALSLLDNIVGEIELIENSFDYTEVRHNGSETKRCANNLKEATLDFYNAIREFKESKK